MASVSTMPASSPSVEYLRTIWRMRYFWFSLAQLDIATRYRKSYLGLAWSLLSPLAMTAVLCMVFQTMFAVNLREYAPFVITGVAIWTFISGTVSEGCTTMVSAEKYLRAFPAPLPVFGLRTLISVSFHFLLILVVAIVLTSILDGTVYFMTPVWLVPGLLLLLLFGWALIITMGVMNVLFPDVQHLSAVALQMLFYMTPIFYKPESLNSSTMRAVMALNPLGYLVEIIRVPVLTGQPASLVAYGASALATAVMICIATGICARFSRRLVLYF